MSNAHLQALEDYLRLQQQLAAHRVLTVAGRAGLMSALAGGQKTATELAEACRMELVPLQLLLAVLVELGVIERYAEHFALAQVARLLPDLNELDNGRWDGLEPWLKSAPREASPASSLQTDAPWMLTPAAMNVAEVLDWGGDRTGLKVLEIAGGPCVVSATLAHRDPASQFVIVDLPAGIAQARATAESIGRLDQFEFRAADPLDPGLEDGEFDLVVLAGVLRRRSEDTCRALLERLARSLKPKGELAVVDWFPGQEKGQRNLAFAQLELGLECPEGGLVTASLTRQWLAAAGLGNVRYAALPAPPHIWGLVLSQKEGAGNAP